MMELSSLTASVTLNLVSVRVQQREGCARSELSTHINELGFFFFLRMAVAVSSTWNKQVSGVLGDQ